MRLYDRMVLTSCQIPLNQGKKYVAVELLTNETLYCIVETKSKVREVLEQVANYLGIKDIYLFGLALKTDNEYFFLNYDFKLTKYAPKQWKTQAYGLDNGKPLLTFLLRIQFYAASHLLIGEKITRFHYYLQLRENVLNYFPRSTEEKYFLLCAYALQADLGNYEAGKHVGQYFEPKDYFPPWILQKLGKDYIIQNTPSIHKDVYGRSRGEAQMAFIQEASYTKAAFNLHLYRLSTKKNESGNYIWIAVCPNGIEVHQLKADGIMEKLTIFLWNNIKKLCFEKRKFEIRVASCPDVRKYTYYASSDEKAKYLLHLCKITHQLSMAMAPKIAELQTLDQDGKKNYRESYIYSDSFDMEWERKYGSCEITYRDFSTLPKANKGHNDQRISVISNTSSNTTSGIVSDKVQSLDGSEDDLDFEIMLNSPPALSVESLPNTAISDNEWEPHSYYRSASAMNFSCNDLPSEILQLKNEDKPRKLENNCFSSNFAVRSQTDSSSSFQSISTVRSCSQLNITTEFDGKYNDDSMHRLSCSCNLVANKGSNSSFKKYLPKTHSANHLDSPLCHCHHYHHHHHHHHYLCNSNSEINLAEQHISPIHLADNSETNSSAMTSLCVKNKIQSCENVSGIHFQKIKPSASSHTTNPRILTSIGVQAPFLPPPNINFQLPQNRTKIGVSSLSRTVQSNKSTNLNSNFSSVPKITQHRDVNSNFIKRLSVNLPPTPLFNLDDFPKYEPVLLNNLENIEVFKTNHTTSPSKKEEEVSEDFQFTDRINCLGENKKEEEFKLGLEEFDYIPPPPLYANPDQVKNECAPDGKKHLELNNLCSSLSNIHLDDEFVINDENHSSRTFPYATHETGSQDSLSLNYDRLLSTINAIGSQFQTSDENCEKTQDSTFIPPPPLPFATKELDKTESRHNSDSNISSSNSIGQHKLDIDNLRRKSKDLDLPLISALCNDRSLVPLTRAQYTLPRRRMSCDHPSSQPMSTLPSNRPFSWHLTSECFREASHLTDLTGTNACSHMYMHSLPCFSISPKKSTPLIIKSSSINSLSDDPIFPNINKQSSSQSLGDFVHCNDISSP